VARATIADLLARERPVVGDGSIGQQLQERDLPAGHAPEVWNLENPDAVRGLHADYADAGARLLTTNTFGGTRPRLAMHGLEERVVEVNRAGVALARAEADRVGALVLGSVGPTGELMYPLGTMEPEAAEEIFAEQARGLAEGGADIAIVETMSDPAELAAAVRGVRAGAPQLEVAATMTFDTHGHTMMGTSPAAALEAIADLGVRIVGANCGNGPGEIEAVMTAMAERRPDGVLLLAQSNAGLPVAVGDAFRYDGTPEVMAAYARRMRDLGVDVIGGCCGTGPEHIRAMRAALFEPAPA
jgi:5-methyltetrahydrofolate--homocysteine methyltransferase